MLTESYLEREIQHALLSLPEGVGYAALVSGPAGAGKSDMVARLTTPLTDWKRVQVGALEWEQDNEGYIQRIVEGRLGHPLGPAPDEGYDPAPLICVDHAQWADRASIRALLSAVRSVSAGNAALLLTVDSDADPLELRSAVDAVFEIPPMDTGEVQRFVSQAVGASITAQTATQMRVITGGNPAYVRQLLGQYPADHWSTEAPLLRVPDDWHAALLRRCPEAEQGKMRELLLATALVSYDDGPQPLTLLESILPGMEETFSAALNAGVLGIHLLGGQRFVYFRHTTDRAAVRAGADIPFMRALHAKAATFYTNRGNLNASTFHWAQSQPARDPNVTRALLERAAALGRAGQWLDAARFQLLAATIAQNVNLEERHTLSAVESLISGSDIRQAKLHASTLPATDVDPHVDSVRGFLAIHEGQRNAADTLLERAWNGAGEAEETAPLRASIAARRTLFHLHEWEPAEIIRWAEITRREAGEDFLTVADTRYLSTMAEGVLRGTIPTYEEDPRETPVLAFRREMTLGWFNTVHDNLAEARQRLQVTTRQEGAHRIVVWMDAWLARTLYLLGEPGNALQVVERGLSRAEQHGLEFLSPLLLWTGTACAQLRGEHSLAASYNNRLTLNEDAFVIQRVPALLTQLRSALAKSDYRTAVRFGRELAAIQERTDISQPGFWPWEDLYARALLATGEHEKAEAVLETAEARAAASHIDSVHARLAVPRANLLIQRGDTAAGLRTFQDAVERLQFRQLPAAESTLLFAYGRALRRLGRRKQADDALAQASSLFQAMGAHELVALADRERRAGGLGERVNGFAGLTPQEEEIARAVATGASNKEVANEFYLSTKTVEYHLTRVYRKLGIRSRNELASALERK